VVGAWERGAGASPPRPPNSRGRVSVDREETSGELAPGPVPLAVAATKPALPASSREGFTPNPIRINGCQISGSGSRVTPVSGDTCGGWGDHAPMVGTSNRDFTLVSRVSARRAIGFPGQESFRGDAVASRRFTWGRGVPRGPRKSVAHFPRPAGLGRTTLQISPVAINELELPPNRAR
jgi:hypothetical protein